MTTFAVTSTNQVLDSVNYLLSNLSTGNTTGNITVPTGTLVADPATGQITATGNVSTGSNGFSYLNQWVNLRYANNATGSSGFSTLPTNSQYFGVYNSNIATPSSNPTEYVWRQVAGGFGTTKTIYYSAFGGRQVTFAAAASPPSSSFVISVANVAIDLDVVTTAAGTPGERGPVVMAYVITTADPTTASSSTLTGWFSASRTSLTPPVGTGLTPVVGDTALFTYPTTGVSAAYEYNGSVWQSATSQVVSGAAVVDNTLSGDAVIGNTLPGNAIVVGTVTGDRITANTITGNLITVGTLTGNLIAANTITGTNIVGNTITGNLIAANTISANSIQANSITATQISSSYIYAGNIVSFGATLGNTSSPGYWLQYNTGNARFGGNVSIGNSLSIGSNASIGGNLAVSGLITAGNLNANTVITTTVQPNAITTSGAFVAGGSTSFVANAVSGTIYTIAGPTVTSTVSNEQVIVWLNSGWNLTLRNNGSSATANGQLRGYLRRYDASVGGPGVSLGSWTTNFTQTMPTAGVDYEIRIDNQSWPVVIDTLGSPGNYVYAFGAEVVYTFTFGTFTGNLKLNNSTGTNGYASTNTIVALGLKR